MRRFVLVLVLAACFAATGCRQSGQNEVSAPKLLRSVPADASGVLYCTRCQDGLRAFLDSADVFNLLDAGKYRNSEAVLSYHYNGEIFRLLSLELGKADTDTTRSVMDIRTQADSLKLHSSYFGSDNPVGRPLLLLSNSQAVLESAARHMSVGTSVLDATGLTSAIGKTAGLKAWAVLKNKDCSKLLGTGGTFSFASRRELLGFLNNAAEWTIIAKPSAGNADIFSSQPEDNAFYMSFLDARTPSESLLGSILPADCSFAISLPIADAGEYIAAHDAWLDARTLLSKYKSDSKAAEQWLRETGLKEIAAVHRGDARLVLLRGKKDDPQETGACSFWQYPSMLFGSMFGLNEGSVCRQEGDWLVCGEEDAVRGFLEQDAAIRAGWPQKAVAVMLLPQTLGVVGAIGAGRMTGLSVNEAESILTVMDKDKLRYGVSVTE